MVTILHPYTLERAQKDYFAIASQFKRQSIIGAAGLGKGSAINELINLGVVESKEKGVYEFSSRLDALMIRHPEYKDAILADKNNGRLVDPRFVRMAYEQDLSMEGFSIDEKIAEGHTVFYDGLPRQAGLPIERNQVEMLKQVHGSEHVFDLVTIMGHSNDYVPILRQLLREYELTHSTGKNGRPDTFKAVKRIDTYNALFADLSTEVRGISDRVITFNADDTTPAQTSFLYLTLASQPIIEEEVRDMKEFAKLGGKEYQMPSYDERVAKADNSSIISEDDEKSQKSVFLLKKQMQKVLWANEREIPFTQFVQMWKDLGYYDLHL